jgi:protein TonB
MFVIDPVPAPVMVASSAEPGGAVDMPVDLPPVPLDAPTGIPPVQLGPAIPTARPWERNPSPPAPVAGPARREGGLWLEAEVDQPAVPIRQPSPRYPPILREAGIEGRVELEFVIDTSGRVEEASLRVVSHSADGFDAAAIESISRSLFTPARVKGQVVRQRARQAIAFRIRTP